MQLWQRRVVGILGIGGGAIGVAGALEILVQQRNPIAWLFSLGFVALYAWGAWCGVRMLEKHAGAERSNLTYWLLQVPVLTSPVLGYFFASGFHLTVAVQLVPLKVNASFLLGSTFNYSLIQSGTPVSLGVNVFALSVAAWLWLQVRDLPPKPSSKPTPLRDAA